MKYIIILLPLVILGCRSTPADMLAFKALDAAWSKIGIEYTIYIDSDTSLNQDQKEVKKLKASEITRLLKEKSK